MTHLIRQLGLTILGLCILISALLITDSMNRMHDELAKANTFQAKYSQLVGAVPMSQLVAMRKK